ncbi:hypothetical protein EF903_04920 [Streptomyces sp. WAC05292]|uniref:hypothetical protein n=1 Tax=Streptomyces sp. WAC05292 TaxID=2487418 RepID=UPI000F73BFE4|nr:hypothetical protein [Streptomyces sp. WAC05292]RSS95337.1 hypothetical protein EF903_04920 [Streptomyces sp. WAC05292]
MRMRRKTLPTAVAAAVAFSGWTAITAATADAAERAVPSATCSLSEGPNDTFGVSGEGFRPGERVTVKNSRGTTVRTTTAIAGGFFEVTGLPNDTYSAAGRRARAVCPKWVSDEEAAIKCTVTKGPGTTYGVSGRGFPVAETVTLKNSSGTVVNTTQTIEDGFFEFTGVPNDTYTVTSKFAKVTCAEAAD